MRSSVRNNQIVLVLVLEKLFFLTVIDHRYPDFCPDNASNLTDRIEDEDDDEDEYEKIFINSPWRRCGKCAAREHHSAERQDHKGRDQEPIFRFCLRALCDLSVL